MENLMQTARAFGVSFIILMLSHHAGAAANTYNGYWTTGSGGGNVDTTWSSDFGPPLTGSFGLSPYTGPHPGTFSSLVSRNFNTSAMHVVSAATTLTASSPLSLPNSTPVHVAFDLHTENTDSGYGLACAAYDEAQAQFDGGPVFFKIVYNFTYTVTNGTNGKVQIDLGEHQSGLAQNISSGIRSAFTTSGNLTGSAASSSLLPYWNVQLYEGQGTPGYGHLVGSADYYFGPTSASVLPEPASAFAVAAVGFLTLRRRSRRIL